MTRREPKANDRMQRSYRYALTEPTAGSCGSRPGTTVRRDRAVRAEPHPFPRRRCLISTNTASNISVVSTPVFVL